MILLRKMYADPMQQGQPQQDQGMSTGTKVLAGLGTAAALAGAYHGARMGAFGNHAQLRANQVHANIGSMVGSQSMVKSGVTGMATAGAKMNAGENWNNMSKMSQLRAVGDQRSLISRNNPKGIVTNENIGNTSRADINAYADLATRPVDLDLSA